MFVYDGECGVDPHGEVTLTALLSQGLPSIVHTVRDLKQLSIKKQQETRKRISRMVESKFEIDKLFSIDTVQVCFTIILYR